MEIRKASSLLLAFVAISLATNGLSVYTIGIHTAYAQATINDPNLRAELYSGGMSFPTSMAFLDNNNILVCALYLMHAEKFMSSGHSTVNLGLL